MQVFIFNLIVFTFISVSSFAQESFLTSTDLEDPRDLKCFQSSASCVSLSKDCQKYPSSDFHGSGFVAARGTVSKTYTCINSSEVVKINEVLDHDFLMRVYYHDFEHSTGGSSRDALSVCNERVAEALCEFK